MMWFSSFDTALFRFMNGRLANPAFDAIMPLLSGNALFIPAVVLMGVALIWRGGVRGRLFVGLGLLILLLGDNALINTLKDAINRPRPFMELADVRLLVGRGGSGSFPSSHASNWFAASALCLFFYPRVWRFVLGAGCLVGFSRVYVGVHYPGDVLGGALLGAGYATALLLLLQQFWRRIVLRWIPELGSRLPSLMPGGEGAPCRVSDAPLSDIAWFRMACLLIGLFLLLRLGYLAAGKIELSEDEAYQWLWSKHPALSYFSKPPMIAWLHALGNTIWGDTMFGSRFTSPVISAILSLVVLRFMSTAMGGRTGFWTVIILNAVPLLAVGSILITVDPPMVLFWMAALVMGWKALQPDGTTAQWCWTGLLIGCSALAKYAGLYQLACWVFVFLALPDARKHLRRPGPWLGLVLAVSCLIPVLVWNAQHSWVTVDHVRFNASRGAPWTPTLRFFWDFLAAESALLNPVLFVATAVAMIRFRSIRSAPRLASFLFWMGAPVFLGYLAFTAYKRVLPNWIAPSVIPLICLSVVYWHERHTLGSRWPARILTLALGLGLPLVVLLHDTRLVGKIAGRSLPVAMDPMRRVQGWRELAGVVQQAREALSAEGLPVFIIGNHYGITSQMAFHIPEARKDPRRDPLVYFRSSQFPENQFFFWMGYRPSRAGQNAIFVQEVDPPPGAAMKDDEPDPSSATQPAPQRILEEFRSVTDLGVFPIRKNGRILRYIQLFACRQLLP